MVTSTWPSTGAMPQCVSAVVTGVDTDVSMSAAVAGVVASVRPVRVADARVSAAMRRRMRIVGKPFQLLRVKR